MGGRGSAYYEKKNSEIEELMRFLQLFKPKENYKKIKYKPDPESERNNYQLFKDLKKSGISTRQSTDTSSLKNLNLHQEQINKLSKKYSKIIKTIPLENEVELSKFGSKSAFGYLQTMINEDGKIIARLALSKLVLDKSELFVEKKQNSIDIGWSVKVEKDNVNIYTTTHEFGHLIEENIIREKFNKLNEIDYFSFRRKEATKIKNEVINICKNKYINAKMLSQDDIYISDYAKSSSLGDGGDYEWFAETFTNMELSKNPSSIALALRDYLRSI